LKVGIAGFSPIPRELKAICEKAMARDPRERYATASLMRDDLQAYLENQPVSAAPDTQLQRAMKWIRRNQRQVKTSLLSSAAVIVIVFSAWFGWRLWRVRTLTSDAVEQLTSARNAVKAGQERSQILLAS